MRIGHGQTILRLFRFKRQKKNMGGVLCKDLQDGQEDMDTDGITFSVRREHVASHGMGL